MDNYYKILAIVLTFAMFFTFAACTDRGGETVPTQPAATQPAAAELPAPTTAPTAAPASPEVIRSEPGFYGHYLLQNGGSLYDVATGMVCATGVRWFSPAAGELCVNLAVLEDGSLIGWYEGEPDVELGHLMGRENGRFPVQLIDGGVIKAEPGCALMEDGRVLVWGGEYAPGSWEDLTAEQQKEYLQPRTVVNSGAVDIADSLVLLSDGTLVNYYVLANGFIDMPAVVDTDVIKLYPDWVYIKSDDTIHVNTWTGENAAEVFVASSQPGWVYYIDKDGRLHGSMDSNDHIIMENVSRIVFDRSVTENVGYSYLLAITNDGGLWWADDYMGDAEPYLIAEGVKDAISDGVNIYVLMNDGSLWAYTARDGVYNENVFEQAPEGEYKLVKVMDGAADMGVVMEMICGDDEAPSYLYSTFYALTEDGRIFNWGHVGEETVKEPAEVYLKRN